MSDANVQSPGVWGRIRNRVLAGLVVVLPIAVTLIVVTWTYSLVHRWMIAPAAQWVIWKVQGGNPDAELPPWFVNVAAPVIAVTLGLLLLYLIGLFAHTQLRRGMDGLFGRVPMISTVYGGVQQMLKTIDKPAGAPRAQRVVLVPFPQPRMRVPAFVTGTCKDIATGKTVVCVYVPTTPMPTSGYMLLVPEEDVVELNWTPEQTLQAIISGGLSAPPEVTFGVMPPR